LVVSLLVELLFFLRVFFLAVLSDFVSWAKVATTVVDRKARPSIRLISFFIAVSFLLVI
jgi:hypothetical protein